MSMLSDYIYQD